MGWSVTFPSLPWQAIGKKGRIAHDSTRLRYRHRQNSVSSNRPDKEGEIVIKKRFTRKQLITHMVNIPAC
jgi:hypothetical protein